MSKCAFCGVGTKFVYHTKDLCLHCGDSCQGDSGSLQLAYMTARALNKLEEKLDEVANRATGYGIDDVS